jgi:predicted O-methyltransferase YrrM
MTQPPPHLKLNKPARLDRIFDAPAEQLIHERIVIYALVFALRPQRILEIGTHWGGTATIMKAALDDIGHGKIICVDPNPLVTPELLEELSPRIKIIKGFSPAVLPKAVELAGGRFDLSFIDGDHTYEGVLRDIEGVVPVLADDSHVILHDSHNKDIRRAIDEQADRFQAVFTDCGELCRPWVSEERDGQEIRWGGLRMFKLVAGR